EHDAPLGHLASDLLARMHDGRVVTTPEFLGDLRVAVVGELPEDVHADLARRYERAPAALATQIIDRPTEHLDGLLEDHLWGDHPGPRCRQEIGEHLPGDVFGERHPV